MRWEPVDIIVLTLTLLVVLVFSCAIIQAVGFSAPMSEKSEDIFANSFASVLAIISLYCGAKIQEKKDRKNVA